MNCELQITNFSIMQIASFQARISPRFKLKKTQERKTKKERINWKEREIEKERKNIK